MVTHAEQQSQDTRAVAAAEFTVLVANASAGNGEALSALCSKCSKDILFQLLNIMYNPDDAADVTQEVLLRVCEKIQNLKEPKAFRGWLARIIHNEKNRFYSNNQKFGVMLNLDDYRGVITEERSDHLPYDSVESSALREEVMGIIAKFPERQREAVMLHYYSDFCVNDVAGIMSISKSTASHYITTASKKIKQIIESRASIGYGFAMMPVGSVLSGVLKYEGAHFVPLNPVALAEITASINAVILSAGQGTAVAAGATVAAASVSIHKIIAGLLAVTVTVTAAIAGGLSIQYAEVITRPVAVSRVVPAQIDIVFTGGEDFGDQYVYVNPQDAYLPTSGDFTQHWWITESGSETILTQGEGDTIGGAFAQLRESGQTGEFVLHLRHEKEDYTTFTWSNFYIRGEDE